MAYFWEIDLHRKLSVPGEKESHFFYTETKALIRELDPEGVSGKQLKAEWYGKFQKD